MKIGLRAGHSDNCLGAVAIVNEHEQMKKYYEVIKTTFEGYGHTIVDCNSNAATENGELSGGAEKANNASVDLFISLHMNASNGLGHGTEALVSGPNSGAYMYAQKLCDNFGTLGFSDRGVKCEKLYEMNHVAAPNIIFELCFCDNQSDIDNYNRYSWAQLAHVFCNAIDPNIPRNVDVTAKNGYIITDYLPHSSEAYDGVDISYILSYFKDVKCYVRGSSKGVWIETEYLNLDKCNELKGTLGSLFYSIET